jgi:hypothetical protein
MTEWQRITWHLFHTISLNYNEKYNDQYIKFFNTFKVIIPCRICRNHYIQNTGKDNMEVENNINSERIFNWTVDLHNSVNKMHRKKTWTYDNARNYYQNNNFNNKILKFFIYEYVRANFKKNFEKTTSINAFWQERICFVSSFSFSFSSFFLLLFSFSWAGCRYK